MVSQDQIAEVVDFQQEVFLKKKIGVERIGVDSFPVFENFVNVISGIRRCGKSTFLL